MMNPFPRPLSLLLLALCGAIVSAELTDAQWAAMKAEKLAKPRVIANDDGCDATSYLKSTGEPTKENYYKFMLDHVKGTAVTTVSYCPFAVGFAVSYPSEVTDRFKGGTVSDAYADITGELLKRYGRDCMMLAQDFARENGLEFFACMRMNDVHDNYMGAEWMCDWKKEHPEYLFGTAENRPLHGEWTAYDYACPEVRARMVAILREMMERYDVDGLELDFYRNLEFFKSLAWERSVSQEERDAFTDMMRTIRAEAERIGRAKGRPVVILCRLPEATDLCRFIGLDVEKWMEEGLFDLYAGGGDRGYYLPAAELAAKCRQYGLKYYGVVNDAYHFGGVFNRNTVPAYHGLQAVAYAAGATGVYLFNCFYFPEAIRTSVIDGKSLRFKEKSYFVSHQHENNWGMMPDGYKQFNRLPELSPYRKFYGSIRKDYVLEVGDDFSDPSVANLPPEEKPTATLYLDVRGHAGDLRVLLNGQELQAGAPNGTTVPYEVPLSPLKTGANTLTLDATASMGTMGAREHLYDGDVHLGHLGRPWWSIYLSGAGTKLIEDGAYRMNDNLTTPNGLVNMLRLFSGLGGAPFRLEFDLKTFPDNAPETAAVRLADGRNIDVIDFRPNEIRLKYADVGVPFATADGFHRYGIDMRGGKLTLWADGKALFTRVPLTKAVGDPRLCLSGHNFIIPPDSNWESMLMGSLNGPGTGSSCWKNGDLFSDMVVCDAVLNVKFPPAIPQELKDAVARIPAWQYEADYADGALPDMPNTTTTYGKPVAAPDGRRGVLIDNEIEGNVDGGIFLKDSAIADSGRRFFAAEWTVLPVRASKASPLQNVFQMVLRPTSGPGKFLNFVFEFNQENIAAPWGPLPFFTDRPRRCLAVADMQTRTGVLYVNGMVAGYGEIEERDEANAGGLCWGDLSPGVGGAYILEGVKLATFD